MAGRKGEPPRFPVGKSNCKVRACFDAPDGSYEQQAVCFHSDPVLARGLVLPDLGSPIGVLSIGLLTSCYHIYNVVGFLK